MMNQHFTVAESRTDFNGSILANREVQGFGIREIVHKSGTKLPSHSHEHAHVAFVLRGVFTEYCEQKTLECKPLSVSFLAPGVSHSDSFPTGAHSFLLELSAQRYAQMRESLWLDEPICIHGGAISLLTLKLYGEIHQRDTASELAIEGLSLEILSQLCRRREFCDRRNGRDQLRDKRPPHWLERAREILHAQFCESLTHEQIAQSVGIHPAHLATVFRRHYRCTMGEYVRRLRVEFACERISVLDRPLSDIALAAGFADQSHLTRVFKRLTNMTPAQFRRCLRNPG
jgi:AraC family transcriptional regulator